MKLNYDSNGLAFRSESMSEALAVSECFQAENVSERSHTWHYLLTRETRDVQDLPAVDHLRLWGIDPSNGLTKVQQVLRSKRKRYRWDMTPIEEVKSTAAYTRALELVKSLFGKPLRDGRIIFPYQIETADGLVTVIRQNTGEAMPAEGEAVHLAWAAV